MPNVWAVLSLVLFDIVNCTPAGLRPSAAWDTWANRMRPGRFFVGPAPGYGWLVGLPSDFDVATARNVLVQHNANCGAWHTDECAARLEFHDVPAAEWFPVRES